MWVRDWYQPYSNAMANLIYKKDCLLDFIKSRMMNIFCRVRLHIRGYVYTYISGLEYPKGSEKEKKRDSDM